VPSSRDSLHLTFSRRIGSLAAAALAIVNAVGCGGSGGSSQRAVTLQSITIAPATALIKVNDTQQFTASGKFSDGSSQNLANVSWAAVKSGIATISPSGVATGVSAGTTKITASASGVNGTASITVAAPAPPGGGGSGSSSALKDRAFVPVPSHNCKGDVLSPVNPNTVAVINLDAQSSTTAVVAHIPMPTNYIPTATAANPVTNQVLVTSCSSPTVLIIDGTTNQIIDSVDAPVTNSFLFSGGRCMICGLLIDPNTNKVILDTAQGFMLFDPVARAFTGPIPNSLPGENFGYDPGLEMVLNPIYNSGPPGFQILSLADTSTLTVNNIGISFPDAAAVDTLTHVGVIPDEGSKTQLLVNMVSSSGNTPHWSTFDQQTTCAELTMVSVDSSIHVAAMAAEDSQDCFALELLPVTEPAPDSAPAVPDTFIWGHIPPTPDNHAWHFGLDPHTTAVFTSVVNGNHFAFLVDKNANWVARVDLAALAGAAPNGAGINLAPYVTFLQTF
jgi:Big-like domain-containing protein